jgi:2',3'-cyclic-nucleotide 2'-phosphodiesterase (5'-nucleotidase family)
MKKTLFIFLLITVFYSCKTPVFFNSKVTANTISVDSSTATNQNISEIIAPYKAQMVSEINTIISYTPKDLTRYDGKMQSSLGNLMADLSYKRGNPLFKEKTGQDIDFALFNYGGIRASVNKGDVTNEDAFKLMPFENSLVVVELSGEKIIELFDYFISNKTAHPISKNIQLTLSADNSYNLLINGATFDKTKNYYVLTSDYLQTGGDKMNFFIDPVALIKIDYKIRDAIIDEFKSLDTIKVTTDNRIILK